jgi:HPt (histidine-containing phosphotransfer) domain-containing protein
MTHQLDNSSRPAVNLPELLLRVDNDRDLACELIVIFREKFPLLLQLLETAVAREDANAVETTSHALTGMLSCLSATRATAIARQLEQMGREGKTSGMTEVLRLFEVEAAKLLPELDGYSAEVKP